MQPSLEISQIICNPIDDPIKARTVKQNLSELLQELHPTITDLMYLYYSAKEYWNIPVQEVIVEKIKKMKPKGTNNKKKLERINRKELLLEFRRMIKKFPNFA
ncbi:MAG: hypothetical protein V1652_03520 [bacterium]